MSTLQNQIIPFLERLPDDSMCLIPDMGQWVALLSESGSMSINNNIAKQDRKRRLGSMKGQKFIADGHDIDECNDEIAGLFEADENFSQKQSVFAKTRRS